MTDSRPNRFSLEIRELRGGWEQTTVIEDITLTLIPGECVSILGRNGVGKSTLLELIVGRAQRSSGSLNVAGQDVTNLSIHKRARLGLRYVPQEREVFPSLTVAEHLSIAALPGRWNLKSIYDLFPSLAARTSSLGSQLSGGEQQMLAMARALIANPNVLLMDEPSEGLAPVVVEQLIEAIKVVTGDNSLTVLLVEQRVDIALELADRCLIMDRGRIVHEDSSARLKASPETISEMMGLSTGT